MTQVGSHSAGDTDLVNGVLAGSTTFHIIDTEDINHAAFLSSAHAGSVLT